ncbi:MAG: helix-turn-helix domain-containing protein [Heliobacteriaceae bacterium]|jgi:transcriptional regulator with XRE-family HTH domain|nr:helix-turn-helix domain-containing protein [Heliobacteriaceae bacterium]
MLYEEFLRILGLRIKYFRKLKKLTQLQVAEMVNTEEHCISVYEMGKRNMTMKTLHKLITAMDIDPAKLFDFSD